MTNLPSYLAQTTSPQVAATINGLAVAAKQIEHQLRLSDIVLDAVAGKMNADGDTQKALDVIADDLIEAALRDVDAAIYMSEERDDAIVLNADGRLIVACDPLDGSSNIGVNLTVGTIFSILPGGADAGLPGGADAGPDALLQAGRNQLAAGFFLYGPQTSLILTTGKGAVSFRLNAENEFGLTNGQVQIPADAAEFAINASNARHWLPPVSSYINACLAGTDGPRKKNFNMRWAGSLVADAWRIFDRGGVFLYPRDKRPGYEDGRLRLVYEAAPIAFIIEQAGGRASDGVEDIMNIIPDALHSRVPLIFGSKSEVAIIEDQHRASNDQI